MHSGARVNPMLSGGTRPPPKVATSVNVWSLPPSFITRRVSSGLILRYAGLNRHAECPITALESGETRKALNSASVTSPSSSVQPPPDAQLGSLGSQSSRIAICLCSRLCSRSPAVTTPRALTNNARAIPTRRIFAAPFSRSSGCASGSCSPSRHRVNGLPINGPSREPRHGTPRTPRRLRSEEHTSELQSRLHLVCRLLLEKKKEELCG